MMLLICLLECSGKYAMTSLGPHTNIPGPLSLPLSKKNNHCMIKLYLWMLFADVHLEAVGVGVALVAEVAGEGLDPGVNVHVAPQVLVLLKP